MPVYEGSHETVLPAAPEDVFAVLTDYEHLHEWQGALERCTVLSRDRRGLGKEVEYVADVRVRKVRYVLRHDYKQPETIGSEYLEGDFRCFEGNWTLEPAPGDKTRARLSLRIDPGLPVPGPVQRLVNKRILKSSVEDLRKRMERN
jgi:ribosome-associated toxin RatA of RatAB toxin-antitoxin module